MRKLPKYVAMMAIGLAASAAAPTSQLWAQDADARPADGRLMADDLPENVRRTIEEEARGTNHFVDRRERDGETRYTVHYTTDDDRRMVIRLDERGRVVEEAKPALVQPRAEREDPSDEGVQFRKVEERDVPDRALRALDKHTDGSRDALYHRQTRNGKTLYSAHYTTPQGERMWVRVAENGEVAAGPNINVTKGIGLASVGDRERDRGRDRDRDRDRPRRERPDRPRPTEQLKQQEISAADVPADIRRVIEKETAGGTEHRFVRESRGDDVTYFVEYTKGGQRANLRLDDRGRVLGEQDVAGADAEMRREELSAADLPADVRRAIEKETAGGSEHKFVRESQGGETSYFVEYTKDGQRANLRVDDRGRVLGEQEVAGSPRPSQELQREELSAAQLPAEVRRTIEQETPGAADHRFIREAQGDQVSYFVEYTKDGQRGNLRVDERGKVIGEQEVAGAPRPDPQQPTPQPANDDDAQVAAARDTAAHQMVAPGDLPAEVRQAIEQQTQGGSNHLFQRHTQEGQSLYTAHYATAEGDYNIIVLDDAGKVLVEPRPSRWLQGRKGVTFEALGAEQLPAEVRQTIEKQAPRATEHLFVRRVRPDAQPTYLVQFTNARGRRMQMEVNANGEVREEPGAAREEPFRLIERKQDRQ